MNISDKGKIKTRWIIKKYLNDMAYRLNRPYEIKQVEGNLFLSEGIGQIWDLVIGAGGTVFDNTNAHIGVGDGTAAEADTQTGLQGTNKAYVGMESGYPSRSGKTVTWRAVFDGSTGNFSWQEFTVANGSDDSAVNINRKVSDQGTKASGQVWTVDLQLTLS